MRKNHSSRRAQVSVEYMFILALSLAIIVPGSILFYNYSRDSNEHIIASQINNIGKNVINQAEDIFTIGKNSWTTVKISFPDSVTNAYIEDNELVISYNTPRGLSDAVFFSSVPIAGAYAGGNITQSFHTGYTEIKIESQGGTVLIGEPVS